jgi:hypothetical protein
LVPADFAGPGLAYQTLGGINSRVVILQNIERPLGPDSWDLILLGGNHCHAACTAISSTAAWNSIRGRPHCHEAGQAISTLWMSNRLRCEMHHSIQGKFLIQCITYVNGTRRA